MALRWIGAILLIGGIVVAGGVSPLTGLALALAGGAALLLARGRDDQL